MTEAKTMVFVIDDEAAMREALQSLIRSVGLSVETFASAREFLTGQRPDAPACLVLDVRCRASADSSSSASCPKPRCTSRSSSSPATATSR